MEKIEGIEELRRSIQEERRLREEAERQYEETQRRLEKALEALKPLTLQEYLEAFHSLELSIEIETDPGRVTQDPIDNPIGCIFPRRIIPWKDFAKQQNIWDTVSASPQFSSQALFPPQPFEIFRPLLRPISSRICLQDFESITVNNAVANLIKEAAKDPVLQNNLGFTETVFYRPHIGIVGTGSSVSESTESSSTTEENSDAFSSASTTEIYNRKRRQKARRRRNRADDYYLLTTSDGRTFPKIAIVYIPPYKLSVDEIVAGLDSEIQPARDVINKVGQGFGFNAKALITAVVTQLFAHMVDRGIRYGYIYTGHAFVFLNIPDDPSTVYYAVRVPERDVANKNENRLHHTAAAQVFAFVVQSIFVPAPTQAWHDEAHKLDVWSHKYNDVSNTIPPSEQNREEPCASPCKRQKAKRSTRSPVGTRSRCKLLVTESAPSKEKRDDAPSTTPNVGNKQPQESGITNTSGDREGDREGTQHQSSQQRQINIKDRPYCTQRCLLGLAYGGPLDENCPNVHDHGGAHISRDTFLRLVRTQLGHDRGADSDCMSLFISGSRGALFKLRLSSSGYTLVAKGMELFDEPFLAHECQIYNKLRSFQGKTVPVCLGMIDLILPWYYDGGQYMNFLFLSWAGTSVTSCSALVDQQTITDKVITRLKQLHRLRLLHCDAKARNIMFDPETGSVMLIDFERSRFYGKQPLLPPILNSRAERRRFFLGYRFGRRPLKEDFAQELHLAADSLKRLFAGKNGRAQGIA